MGHCCLLLRFAHIVSARVRVHAVRNNDVELLSALLDKRIPVFMTDPTAVKSTKQTRTP